MQSYMSSAPGMMGFGLTPSDADEDLLINLCRSDINNDESGRFAKRREELFPWMPSTKLLHISGIGGIKYDGKFLINTKTGVHVELFAKDLSIYYYLACLFGSQLSYSDIAVCLRPELDEFFQNISTEFTLLNKYPLIRITNGNTDFRPIVSYNTNDGVVLGVSPDDIGIKYLGDSQYYTVRAESIERYVPVFAYIGYRAGIIFNEGGIIVDGKEDNVL